MSKYIKQFTRPFNVQRIELSFELFYKKQNVKTIIIPVNDEKADYYIDSIHWDYVMNKLKNIFSNRKNFKKHLEKFKKQSGQLLKVAYQLEKCLVKNDKNLIFSKYLECKNETLNFANEFFYTPMTLDTFIVPYVQDLLKRRYAKNKEEIWLAVNNPTRLLSYQKARIELLKLYVSGKIKNDMHAYTKKWGWMGIYDYIQQPFDEKYFLKSLKNISKKEAIDEIKKTEKFLKECRKKYKESISLIKDSKVKFLLEIINEYVALRTDRVDVWRKSMVPARSFYVWLLEYIKQISNDTTWSLKEIINLTTNEIEEVLLHEKIPSASSIRGRGGLAAIFSEKGVQFVGAKEITKKHKIEMHNGGQEVIRGQIASPGKAKAHVRKIMTAEDLNNFRKGEILVTQMTHPEYVPAMKKAAAIITDEGGITCHAAIISRELKKPCIIGTKIATKVLKDGDLVEADADKGIVRKLEK